MIAILYLLTVTNCRTDLVWYSFCERLIKTQNGPNDRTLHWTILGPMHSLIFTLHSSLFILHSSFFTPFVPFTASYFFSLFGFAHISPSLLHLLVIFWPIVFVLLAHSLHSKLRYGSMCLSIPLQSYKWLATYSWLSVYLLLLASFLLLIPISPHTVGVALFHCTQSTFHDTILYKIPHLLKY